MDRARPIRERAIPKLRDDLTTSGIMRLDTPAQTAKNPRSLFSTTWTLPGHSGISKSFVLMGLDIPGGGRYPASKAKSVEFPAACSMFEEGGHMGPPLRRRGRERREESEVKQVLRFRESDGLHRSPEIGPHPRRTWVRDSSGRGGPSYARRATEGERVGKCPERATLLLLRLNIAPLQRRGREGREKLRYICS